MMTRQKLDSTLEERGSRYGDFGDIAEMSQRIKKIMRDSACRNPYLEEPHMEGLEMIACKMARIVCGDPNYLDNWHDIAGYATLMEKRIEHTSITPPAG
jgi:hypothetical protein